MGWLDKMPLIPLALIAIFLALAPFRPEPHLLEKMKMLFAGTLTRPIDIVDLLMHAAPLIVLILKIARMVAGASNAPQG